VGGKGAVLIRATYSVVTPLFSSGAIQERAELRLPAFKGVLRFWWRALAWSRFHGDLQRIHQEESNTFGSPSGQSAVWMRLKHTGPFESSSPRRVLASPSQFSANTRAAGPARVGMVLTTWVTVSQDPPAGTPAHFCAQLFSLLYSSPSKCL